MIGELLSTSQVVPSVQGVHAQGGNASPPASSGVMSATEMSQFLEAFNGAAARLQSTHEALTSEVVRLRRELRDANEAVERSRRLAALGEMAAGIAHEVRNPLGSIRLYAKMLEEDLGQQPQLRQQAVKIISATRAVEAIVGDVLSFAREIKVRHDRVNARIVFDAALEHLTHASVVGAASTRIVRDVEQEERVELVCDSALLAQAIANIVRNAMEAMHEHNAAKHEIVLQARAAKLAFGSGRRVSACVISVMDTGPGIPHEVVERMFNPFFTTRQHGTGLGLAIVHRIVDAHGGRVSVRNNADAGAPVVGACVSVVLPGASDEPQIVVNSEAKNRSERIATQDASEASLAKPSKRKRATPAKSAAKNERAENHKEGGP